MTVFNKDRALIRNKGSQHMWKNNSVWEGETNFYYFGKGENDTDMEV